jgi:UDP-N-acetyl-D-glucosamine dehydrogenase
MNEQFRARIQSREARIAVVGLGYVGLPLAMAFADAGFHVTGVDSAANRVERLQRGENYVLDVDGTALRRHVESGQFAATIESALLAESDVIFVCVPTPFDRAKAPDLKYIRAAATSIASELRRDQLVILESTTYPGTTDEVLVPILEGSGLKCGRDFFVAFSPERIDPGNKTFGIRNTPKVVGGTDLESSERAEYVLQQVVSVGQVHRVSTTRAAELTKLLENTFRAVNIALVNELAVLCDRMHIDVWEVIAAAKTKPYGFMAFYPGPGPGGHCIPVDPYYLAWKAREYDFSTKFIELAAQTNQSMPFFTASKIRRQMLRRGMTLTGSEVLVLGAAFKPDIDDDRNSTAVRVIEILRDEGARVVYHDPYVPLINVAESVYGEGECVELRSSPLSDELLARVACVAILVGHTNVDYQRVLGKAVFIFDAVNALRGQSALDSKVARL